MSGGHYDYKQGDVALLGGLIDQDLRRVGTTNEWGDTFQPEPSTIAAMSLARALCESLSDLVHDIDWCLSGDTGDDTFRQDMAEWLETWQPTLNKLMDACPRCPKGPAQ
jgi:hypothetical protein